MEFRNARWKQEGASRSQAWRLYSDRTPPGEDRAAFEKLHRDLKAELRPEGTLESNTVTTIARLIWRKQNLDTIRLAERVQKHCSEIQSQLPKSAIDLLNLDDIDPDEREAACRAAEDQARKELGDAYQLLELGKQRHSLA